MTLLRIDHLTVRRGHCPVVDDVSLTVAAGEVVGLIGPNGAGKTTLMRAALGLMPHRGTSSLAQLAPAARARAAAFLPQGREVAWPVTVADLVALGRAPWARDAAADRAAVDRAIARMGLAAQRDRPATALSGGEQARALIARVLAQDTPLLIADEPVAGLDPEAQLRTLAVFADLAAEGRGVLLSIHDLGLAARACTRLVLMQAGRIVADGAPRAVLTAENLARVFRVQGHLAEVDGTPLFQPLRVVD
ncbi:MAG: ABC transporter ATP-binding protein [Rhodobacterales bacterium]|nr:ABC transporter ATP-binding protein [Rhodobacterales bacterium]